MYVPINCFIEHLRAAVNVLFGPCYPAVLKCIDVDVHTVVLLGKINDNDHSCYPILLFCVILSLESNSLFLCLITVSLFLTFDIPTALFEFFFDSSLLAHDSASFFVDLPLSSSDNLALFTFAQKSTFSPITPKTPLLWISCSHLNYDWALLLIALKIAFLGFWYRRLKHTFQSTLNSCYRVVSYDSPFNCV